jgi:hypothetical protein
MILWFFFLLSFFFLRLKPAGFFLSGTLPEAPWASLSPFGDPYRGLPMPSGPGTCKKCYPCYRLTLALQQTPFFGLSRPLCGLHGAFLGSQKVLFWALLLILSTLLFSFFQGTNWTFLCHPKQLPEMSVISQIWILEPQNVKKLICMANNLIQFLRKSRS